MFSSALPRTAARPARRAAAAIAHRPFIRPAINFPPVLLQRCAQGRRHQSTATAARALFRKHPLTVPLAVFSILVGMAGLMYAPYAYHKYIIEQYRRYPEPVAKKLRRAVFYTNVQLDPREAIKYYKQGLQVADEIGMDPFSDEILGVKFQLAALFEKIQNYRRAIDVLEIVRRDCLRWMDEFSDRHINDGKRTHILQKLVGMHIKLGELYSNEHIMDKEAAEERLVWAVETVLKEHRRRETDGVEEGEGEWLSSDEIGASLESLAHHYESKNLHYLATPLFLQALTLSPPQSCHSVVLMNNLAISLSQQTPPPTAFPIKSSTSPTTNSISSPSSLLPNTPGPSRADLVSQARQWATRALSLAANIKAPERDEECDIGCVAATHALAEFAEMDGNIAEARRRYNEALSLAKAVGFDEGAQHATEGLNRVAALAKSDV